MLDINKVRKEKPIHRKKDVSKCVKDVVPKTSTAKRSTESEECPKCHGNAHLKKTCIVCETKGFLQSRAIIRKKIINKAAESINNPLCNALNNFQQNPTPENEKKYLCILMEKLSNPGEKPNVNDTGKKS